MVLKTAPEQPDRMPRRFVAGCEIRPIIVDDPHAAPPLVAPMLDAVRSQAIDHYLLHGAYDSRDRLITAALLVPQPGRTAMVFPAGPRRRRDVAPLGGVIDGLCRAITPGQCAIAQALLEPTRSRERAAFEAAGFCPISTLGYMQAHVPADAPRPDALDGYTLFDARRVSDRQFVDALEATYHQSLDCPALRQLREGRDVLAGHRGRGVFKPELWSLLMRGDEPAAALLLSHQPEARCVELVYLGVNERFRRRGLARWLVRYAMWQSAALREKRMTLGVDLGNAPALELYRQFLFKPTARKLVMLRAL